MNKFEILAWGLLISFFTAAISGPVVLWWLARKGAVTKHDKECSL
ncbi:putative phage replication protein [Acinetobacter baumannii]|nr:putative phage replication protein [Acinetobacter baumannii]MCT9547252.1 putative phage replication protein [Acinetobacter baumannii]MDC4421009.1 putative phage replication protein [Acinetobacter baumannii]MDC4649526.1 putative phage replication protein [Acinetobacter baumannii]MDC5493904.1 putative phage replication protein [Acinetobacter baumannii]MDC5571808.1 putative phage replication protein [Acinetobacter baumannii]